MNKKRLQILKDYKRDVLEFGLLNILVIIFCLFFNLIIDENKYNMAFLPLLICGLIWIGLLIIIFKKTYNRNYFLWVASLLIVVYGITFDETLRTIANIFIIFSFIYEVIMRFWIGIEIKSKFKELPWNELKKEKKK